MTDFRAELQALVTAYDKLGKWPQHEHEDALFDAVEHARAALAQSAPPAEGDGEWPTDEQLIEAYQRAYQPAWERGEHYGCHIDGLRAALAIALDRSRRAAPVPLPVAWGNFQEDGTCVGLSQHPEDIARWLNPRPLFLLAPAPVPVSERLPGPEDCDAEGRCWCFDPAADPEIMDGVPSWEFCHWEMEHTHWLPANTHWLPAHALPLPAGEVQP